MKVPPSDFVKWMNSYCEAFVDLPEDAWETACEDAVKVYNEKRNMKINPRLGRLQWVLANSRY